MAAVEAAAVVQQPVSAKVVGNAFVQQYYHILHHSPALVHRFYQDISKLGRPEDDGSMTITTTMQAINDKIVSLNYGDFRAEIKSVDSQESLNNGVSVLVTGYLTGKDLKVSNFTQMFFLAPQDKGYFVLNDMFRYVNSTTVSPPLVSADVVPVAAEPVPAPVQENHVPVAVESPPSVEEAVSGEVYNPPENEDVAIADEEIPVPEVVNEVQNDAELVVESPAKIEEVPKKSYASIVMRLKENAKLMGDAPVVRKVIPVKRTPTVNPTPIPAPDVHVSSLDSADNGHNQEGEADGYSIYVKGLPMTASVALLEDVFKKFGTIKKEGIQVRSNRQQQFCFGFVEFEEASSVHKAIEASPVAIGGRQSVIEEKRSTNTRGSIKGRFQPVRGGGGGFRNEGPRGGRGGFGGGRGYNNNRPDFNNNNNNNGRSDYPNRGGGNRGNSQNRDGYQNVNSNGGPRMNRGGATANGNSKNMAPAG